MIPKPFIKTNKVFRVKDEIKPGKIINSNRLSWETCEPTLMEYMDKWCGTTQSTITQDVTPIQAFFGVSGSSRTYGTSGYEGLSGTFGLSGSSGFIGTSGSGGLGMVFRQTSTITSQPQVNDVQIPHPPPNSHNINWNIMGESKTFKYTIPINSKKWWQFWKESKSTSKIDIGYIPPEEGDNVTNKFKNNI